MHPRIDLLKASPEAIKPMYAIEAYLKNCGLEHSLLLLVKMRASQINGCSYCLDMHSKDARAEGETEPRLYALSAWEHTPFFNDRERNALALTETITLVSASHVPDDVYERAKQTFSEEELTTLTMAI